MVVMFQETVTIHKNVHIKNLDHLDTKSQNLDIKSPDYSDWEWCA